MTDPESPGAAARPRAAVRSEQYLEGVRAVYQGEVLGEAMFSELLRTEPEPARRPVFASMLQMETETKARLRPLLARIGIDPAEDEAWRARGRQEGQRLRRLPWAEFLVTFEREIGDYVARYQALADLAPGADAKALRFMVEHERVFLRFVAAERAGRPREALAIVAAQLHWPLRESATSS